MRGPEPLQCVNMVTLSLSVTQLRREARARDKRGQREQFSGLERCRHGTPAACSADSKLVSQAALTELDREAVASQVARSNSGTSRLGLL